MNDSELEIKLQPPQKPLTEAEPTARSSLRVNVLLALITLVGAFATLWGVKVAERSRLDAKHLAEQQLTEQRRQFDAQLAEQKRQAKYNDDRAERSAIAAENSAETTRKALTEQIRENRLRSRAWVVYDHCELMSDWEASREMRVQCFLKNSVGTIAFKLHSPIYGRYNLPGIWNFAPTEHEPDNSTTVLSPGQLAYYESVLAPQSEDVIEKIKTGKLQFYVYGEATYEDEAGKIHSTQWCGYYWSGPTAYPRMLQSCPGYHNAN